MDIDSRSGRRSMLRAVRAGRARRCVRARWRCWRRASSPLRLRHRPASRWGAVAHPTTSPAPRPAPCSPTSSIPYRMWVLSPAPIPRPCTRTQAARSTSTSSSRMTPARQMPSRRWASQTSRGHSSTWATAPMGAPCPAGSSSTARRAQRCLPLGQRRPVDVGLRRSGSRKHAPAGGDLDRARS